MSRCTGSAGCVHRLRHHDEGSLLCLVSIDEAYLNLLVTAVACKRVPYLFNTAALFASQVDLWVIPTQPPCQSWSLPDQCAHCIACTGLIDIVSNTPDASHRELACKMKILDQLKQP